MAAGRSFPVRDASTGEDRVLLWEVPWSTYLVIRDTVDRANVRMTYLDGALEIMRPSSVERASLVIG